MHRIDASLVMKMQDNDVDQWVVDVIAKSLLLSDGGQ